MLKPHKLLAVLLLLSALVTGFLGFHTLSTPEAMMHQFGVTLDSPDGLELLLAVLGAVLLSLSAIQCLAGHWSWRDRHEGKSLSSLLACTLLLVAACAWLLAGSTQVLLLDGIRGGLMLILAILWKPGA